MANYSTETRETALARIANGEKPAAVAEELGVKESTVYYWLRKEREQTGGDEEEAAEDTAEDEQEAPSLEAQLEQVTAERDFALAILEEFGIEMTPEAFQVLLSGAKRLFTKSEEGE